jgi:imidazolonepropionase-like amidohydrolase
MTRLLLAAGSVLDVASGEISAADVVLEGDRIVAIGNGLDADAAVDCSGGLLLPGFLDCHTHVCLSYAFATSEPLSVPRSASPLSAVPVLRTLLRLGITTVRDAWGADAGLRLALRQGWIDGPDVLISIRQVCTTGGIGDHWAPRSGAIDFFGDPSMPDPVFDGVDGARAVVRRMVRAGADWIKVTATGSIVRGVGVHDVQLTAEEMTALVDEAARQGQRQVMVHAHGARAAELAARCGARSIEHGTWLDEPAIAAMLESGTWFVPTLSCTQADPDAEPTGAAEAHRRAVRLAVEAGVPIAMGTDNPVRPHSEALREIQYLSEAGLGPAGALRAATLDAARLLGLAEDRGEIADGKRADLVLLNGTSLDPTMLENRIRAVWHNGRQVAAERTD